MFSEHKSTVVMSIIEKVTNKKKHISKYLQKFPSPDTGKIKPSGKILWHIQNQSMNSCSIPLWSFFGLLANNLIEKPCKESEYSLINQRMLIQLKSFEIYKVPVISGYIY